MVLQMVFVADVLAFLVDGTGSIRYDHVESPFVTNSLIEQDMQHQLWLLTLSDKLYLAPIKPDPHHVLDLGTGTGIWAIDFGSRLSLAGAKYC